MTTSPYLTAGERNALYSTIVARITGIDYVYTAIENEEFEKAGQLSCEFADLLRLILDLGWGDEGKGVVLTTPDDALYRALKRLEAGVEEVEQEEAAERESLAALRAQNRIVRKVCAQQIERLKACGNTELLGEER